MQNTGGWEMHMPRGGDGVTMRLPCDDCNQSHRQRVVWRKLHGRDVFTGIVLVPNECSERDEWTARGYPYSCYRLVDPSDVGGARVRLSPGEFVGGMQRYD